MIDDMRHLAVFDGHAREMEDVIRRYYAAANGVTDKARLAELARERNASMVGLMVNQERAIRFLLGEKVEPMVHHGEAVLLGTFGAGQ